MNINVDLLNCSQSQFVLIPRVPSGRAGPGLVAPSRN